MAAEPDPTAGFGWVNALGNALTKSPLNEGKKAVVKALAGSYDEAATRAKLDSMVEENSVLMLSFTT